MNKVFIVIIAIIVLIGLFYMINNIYTTCKQINQAMNDGYFDLDGGKRGRCGRDGFRGRGRGYGGCRGGFRGRGTNRRFNQNEVMRKVNDVQEDNESESFGLLSTIRGDINVSSNISSNVKLNSGLSLRGGKVPNVTLPKAFPQVGVVTNSLLKTTPLDKFVWLEKTDGIHHNILIYENVMYDIVRQKHTGSTTSTTSTSDVITLPNSSFVLHKLTDLPSSTSTSTSTQTILDTEFYNNNYYIFDAPMINGKDISTLSFIDRMSQASEFISTNKIPNMIMKTFEPVTDIQQLIKYINENEVSPTSGNNIDGVVLQRIDLPYYHSGFTCFKLKRTVMNTIDFKLFYEKPEEVFYLYLYGGYNDIIRNRKKLPRINKYSKQHTGVDLNARNKLPDKLYVLFCSPYKEGLHKFKPRSSWNTNGYFESNIKEVNDLMKEILDDPESFNGSIIEMSLAEDGWVPMRKRNDKPFSNSYAVGLSNSSVVFNPVGSSPTSYFSRKLAFGEDITIPYHDINHMLRKYIIEHSINPLNKTLNVLDLAGGRGGDEVNLYNSGAVNIFAADADKDALVQYVERTQITPLRKYEFLLPESKAIKGLPRSIYINAIHAYLNEDNSSIVQDIKSRFEYPNEGFDVILMNYAIHYLCYKKQCVVALKELVKNLLKPGGLFIFSCFDGDKIMNDMKVNDGSGDGSGNTEVDGNNELKLKTFTIKLIEPEMESDEDAKWARMPLPTIDETGYRAEPLVQQKYLDLLDMNVVEHYYPVEKCDLSKINNHELVDDYLKYIQVYVMRN